MPPHTVPAARLVLAWAVLLGGMVGYWFVRPYFDTVTWSFGAGGVLYATSKFASLVCMPPEERRRLSWGRYVAYLFWPGMQPRHFLPERAPADSETAPTAGGVLLNAMVGALLLWVIPALVPAGWPASVRVAMGLAGAFLLVLLAAFDALALAYRACGVGVEKLWDCPAAATSLADFWGRRWNRIFSGMFREVLFLPLARRAGVGAASFAVFLYSGVLHEYNSVASESGYGLPTLYFLIQFAGAWLEHRRAFRRVLHRRPWLGRLWTAAVVLGPVTLLFHEGFGERVLVPILAMLGVPGVGLDGP